MSFFKKTFAVTALILTSALMVSVNFVLAGVLGAWLVAADIAFVLAGAIFASHIFNLSIPGVRQVLRRAYFRAKFKKDRKKQAGVFSRVYLQFLAYLILLFKSAEEGFDVVKDEAHELYSDALIFIEKHGAGRKQPATREHLSRLFDIHAGKQRRAAAFSVSALGLFVAGVLVIGLAANLMFPSAQPTEAATYGWVQTDWSGGSSTSTADHTDDRTGWTQYFTKDPNVNVSTAGEISLSSPMEDWVETTDTEFNAGSHENTTVTTVNDGEVSLLKPVGASCSVGECAAGCINGTCQLCDSSMVGDSGGGGVIAFCDGDTFYIAQSSDISGGTSWGCYGTEIGCGNTAVGTGEVMTQCIVDNCAASGIAARLCHNSTENGYEDWFLPSKDELDMVYGNKSAIGGFSDVAYWSSSETSLIFAWGQNFDDGYQFNYNKNLSRRVRCLRSF